MHTADRTVSAALWTVGGPGIVLSADTTPAAAKILVKDLGSLTPRVGDAVSTMETPAGCLLSFCFSVM